MGHFGGLTLRSGFGLPAACKLPKVMLNAHLNSNLLRVTERVWTFYSGRSHDSSLMIEGFGYLKIGVFNEMLDLGSGPLVASTIGHWDGASFVRYRRVSQQEEHEWSHKVSQGHAKHKRLFIYPAPPGFILGL